MVAGRVRDEFAEGLMRFAIFRRRILAIVSSALVGDWTGAAEGLASATGGMPPA